MCVRLFLEGGTRIKCRVHKVFVNCCFFRGIKEYENKFVEGRDINLESGSASPLGRKDRGSHPVPGSGLKQRGQDSARSDVQLVADQLTCSFAVELKRS